MSSHEAKGDRQHLDNIRGGDGRLLAGIRCEPQEERVNGADSKLKRRNGHGESSLSSCGVQGHLVGNIVVVVTQVPQNKVDEEAKVDDGALLGRRTSSGDIGGRVLECLSIKGEAYMVRLAAGDVKVDRLSKCR